MRWASDSSVIGCVLSVVQKRLAAAVSRSGGEFLRYAFGPAKAIRGHDHNVVWPTADDVLTFVAMALRFERRLACGGKMGRAATAIGL